MATASVTNNFTNGTPADAEQVDANFADLVGFLNNSVVHRDGSKAMTASLDAGSQKIVNLATGTATNDGVNKGQLDTATGAGAWTTWTPQIDQGVTTNIAKTVNYSKYVRIGRTIHWSFGVTLTAAGTAGSAVTLTVPVTAATGLHSGVGMIYDSSANQRAISALEMSGGVAVAFATDASSANFWGAVPSVALASGDVLNGSITYEAAS